MIEKSISLKKLNFFKVLKYVILSFKCINRVVFIFCLIILASGIVLQHIEMFLGLIKYLIMIYAFGVILSLAIHEYMHILLIKKLTNHQEIKIVANWKKFSVKPLQPITGARSIIIACSGPLVCFVISIFLILLYPDNNVMFFLAICYGFHILSLLPFSGDGLMVVKEIYRFIKRR